VGNVFLLFFLIKYLLTALEMNYPASSRRDIKKELFLIYKYLSASLTYLWL